MSYEYTDQHGYKLTVMPCPNAPGGSRVGIDKSEEDDWQLLVKSEDAPAICLAILEAAGVHENKNGDPDVMSAWHALNAYKIRREEDTEREAEDAKVDAYRRVKVGPTAPFTPWEHLTEMQRNLWREDYRAAREFFTRTDDGTDYHAEAEKPAPRVINYGDPEPDRRTQWRDRDGDLWKHDGQGWHWVPTVRMCAPNRRDWSAIEGSYFPMTEVAP